MKLLFHFCLKKIYLILLNLRSVDEGVSALLILRQLFSIEARKSIPPRNPITAE